MDLSSPKLMDKLLLVTRPNHDYATRWLSAWAGQLLEQAKKSGIKSIDLSGEKARLKELEGRLGKVKPDLVVLIGHGGSDMVTGQDNEPLISLGKNEGLLANFITYAISCNSASQLGPECVRKGSRAYIGYREEFAFVLDESKTSRPLEDNTARTFLDPAFKVAHSLLKGHSAKESHDGAIEMHKKTIRKLLTSDSQKDAASLLPFLFANMNRLVCLGNSLATI